MPTRDNQDSIWIVTGASENSRMRWSRTQTISGRQHRVSGKPPKSRSPSDVTSRSPNEYRPWQRNSVLGFWRGYGSFSYQRLSKRLAGCFLFGIKLPTQKDRPLGSKGLPEREEVQVGQVRDQSRVMVAVDAFEKIRARLIDEAERVMRDEDTDASDHGEDPWEVPEVH